MGADQLLALAVFALVGSFTPGPNTTIAAATGANHGFAATLPHIAGVPFGFSTMLLAATGGVAALIVASPALSMLLKWLGIAYLLWLASALARSRDAGSASGPFALPLAFWQSALFQYLNPKAWMLVVATAATWLATEHPWRDAAIACAVFSLACVASLVLWAAVGAALRKWLSHGARLRRFNIAMGALLAATALWMGVA
ncbi:MAG: LysE family translocator [Burkholderiaceae bacterium]|nr:LysE family translocator [Burkholderiaceae bacterium]